MLRLPRTYRSSVAVGIAVLLTALSAVVPLMDRGGPVRDAVVTDDGPSGYVHHHVICLQHSAAAWSPSTGAGLTVVARVTGTAAPSYAPRVRGRHLRSLHHPRAPPLI